MTGGPRRLRRAWFRATRRLGGGPIRRGRTWRLLASMPVVAFAVAFGLVVVTRDAPRASELPASGAVALERRTAAPAPQLDPVELRPTAALPTPLAPPPPPPPPASKPRRVAPAPAPAPAAQPVTPAAAPTPAPIAAPAPTPRAQPEPTPAPTFDDSGSFDLK